MLTEHQRRTLDAFADEIIPPDDEPGGAELGATEYLSALAAADEGFATFLVLAVSALDEASFDRHGRAFNGLDVEERHALLLLVESGRAGGQSWRDSLAATAALAHSASASLPAGGSVGNSGGTEARLADSSSAQRSIFGELARLCKVAPLTNYPETEARDAGTGEPVFSDPEHAISNPDDPRTVTGWTVFRYRPPSWETERLLWAWQAGKEVVGFDGVPVFAARDLDCAERLAARELLFSASEDGLA